jgi:hypothetical protein
VRLLSVVILFLMATGCHSIHSRSVRDLIQLEGTKIDAAQTNIDLFQKETEARIKFLEQARSSLHESFKSLQIQETKHRFALASFRNLTTKKGDAAYAAAYLTSLIYMADAQGLEKAVWNQFEEDFLRSARYGQCPQRLMETDGDAACPGASICQANGLRIRRS